MNEEVIEGILYLLQGTAPTFDGIGFTYLQIKEFLKINGIKGFFENDKSSILRLRHLLHNMEENDLIEERHFDEKYNGRVDYAIENKGLEVIKDMIKKAKTKGIKLDDKWKIPE